MKQQPGKNLNDVYTFWIHYINSLVDKDVEKLQLFCDNCLGQNKNHALVRMAMALVDMKKFKS